jgi:23S rRNA (cytosine1962-C5)-methyltransferase
VSSTAYVVLLPGREKRIQGGHPWIFGSEVAGIRGQYEPGDHVDVVTTRGGFVGRGYINPASQIIVRLLTRRQDEILDENFYRLRVREAVAYRRALWNGRRLPPAAIGERACRLIFAEADYLPAFIVDYFAGHIVFQALALGVDVRKDLLVSLVREEATAAGFPVLGVYERNDAPVRGLEGLRLIAGPFWGEAATQVTIRDGDLSMIVDLAGGQKTGYFLDQSENRTAIELHVHAAAESAVRAGRRGARVLDCFCYTGSFALSAAGYGAVDVLGVDSSAQALALARENARLNGFEADGTIGVGGGAPHETAGRVSFVEANVFDFLRQAEAEGLFWDMVLLDPPSFAKNRAALEGALRGYKEINLRAMRLISPGGYLVTSSCSQHVPEELFRGMLASAAIDTRRRVRVIESRSQAQDHPTLPGAPETKYLKFLVLRLD